MATREELNDLIDRGHAVGALDDDGAARPTDDPIDFDVYLPATGNPLSESRDGSLIIRLAVDARDRDNVHRLIDAMRRLGGTDDDGNVVHLVGAEIPKRTQEGR